MSITTNGKYALTSKRLGLTTEHFRTMLDLILRCMYRLSAEDMKKVYRKSKSLIGHAVRNHWEGES